METLLLVLAIGAAYLIRAIVINYERKHNIPSCKL